MKRMAESELEERDKSLIEKFGTDLYRQNN